VITSALATIRGAAHKLLQARLRVPIPMPSHKVLLMSGLA